MSPDGRRALRVLVATILAVLACGDPQRVPPRLLLEDFEETCGELPCGWEQISGEDGQARYASTIHSGEHGLLLRGPGVSVRGPGGNSHRLTLQLGSVDAHVSAQCSGGSSLILRAAITVGGDGGAAVTDTFEGRVTPDDDFTSEDIVTLTATMALDTTSPFGCGAGGTFCSPDDFRVTGMTIEKTGSGECMIDRIVIDAVGFLEEPDTSC